MRPPPPRPDLRQVVLGSEGVFGVITSVRLLAWLLPEARRIEGWQVADFPAVSSTASADRYRVGRRTSPEVWL